MSFTNAAVRSSASNLLTSLSTLNSALLPLSPLRVGEALRHKDSLIGNILANIFDVVSGQAKAATHSPITVGSSVTRRDDGTKLTTIYIDVQANFRVDGGTLPTGVSSASEARAIERAIERDFSKSYTDPGGNTVRYVTNVNMTVGQPESDTRAQFIMVAAGDSRLGGGAGTLGRAPGFEHGRIAYISDQAGARTAPHEFGHLAGLRHTAQVDQGCVTGPGISIDNLMSQTGCSATSHQIERQQLQQIYHNPVFR
ncbi:hypothetical protein ACFOWX_12995 [Sphingorhabdus arenilitoris]|uniref:Uncharacterized protein n=1 Tax=Sphingorhabdus arenilitoris TaxID=1490041 RepID=A0ABV8RJD0_9SPHN